MKKSAAIAIIFTPDKQQILLVKRRDVPVWVLPGGGIDAHETPENAAIREALEETGLSVKIERPIAEYTPINRLASRTFTFECTPLDGELATGDETRDLRFFPIRQLPVPFFFVHHDWLVDALKQEAALIQKPLNQVTYFNLFLYFIRHPLQVVRMLLSRLGIPINS